MSSAFENRDSLLRFVVKEGCGVKGLMDSGISAVPQPYVQPPIERIDAQITTKWDYPPIDLSTSNGREKDLAIREVIHAAETLGFFQVINHGVPLEVLESLKSVAHGFFAQAPEKKVVYKKGMSISPFVNYGTSFVPEKEKCLEWKDYVSMVYTNDDDALKHWPEQCRDVVLQYLKSSTEMVKRLLRVLFENLGESIEESRMEDLLGQKMVNMNFYPACPNPELTVGVGRHSDMGTLTVLLQDGIGGLYVKLEEGKGQRKGQWVEIPPVPGALVINIGDMLQILSNGRYKSAEHRVRTTSTQARVSIPIFTMPKRGVKIGPLMETVKKDGVPRYKDFLFQDYMNNFFGNAHDGKKSLDFTNLKDECSTQHGEE